MRNARTRWATWAGCSRWAACPASGTRLVAGVLPDGGRGLATEAPIGLVVLAGEDEHRHREVREVVPERDLTPGAEVAQGGRQSRGVIGQPFGALVRLRRQRGEQRLGQPLVEERVEPDRLEVVGQLVVGSSASLPFVAVLDAGVGADEDEGGDQVGLGEGQVQGHPTAEGVAEIAPPAAGPTQSVAGLGQVPSDRRGAVAGEVDGLDRTLIAEGGEERPPAAGVLGEPVGQDQGRALTAHDPRVLGRGRVDGGCDRSAPPWSTSGPGVASPMPWWPPGPGRRR